MGSILSTALTQAAMDSGSSRHSSSVIPTVAPFGATGSTRSSLPSGQSTGSAGTIWPLVQVALIAFMTRLLSSSILLENAMAAVCCDTAGGSQRDEEGTGRGWVSGTA